MAAGDSASPLRLMLSCDNCRKKKIRCNGGRPECASCLRGDIRCHYSPVGPRKKPRRAGTEPVASQAGDGVRKRRANKRRASASASDSEETHEDEKPQAAGVSSVSHLMLERLRDTQALALPHAGPAAVTHRVQPQQPVMEMLRLQTQISDLVDQLRNITIQVSGMTPTAGSPAPTPAPAATSPLPLAVPHPGPSQHSLGHTAPAAAASSGMAATGPSDNSQGQACSELHLSKPEHARGVNVSRDLIKHLISVYFQYCHPSETGMYPMELYRDRLQRAQVSETFLLSVLAVASRLSDDPRVKREPAYLAGYDFFERVTRGLMMDVLERDCVENMLTLNNLAVYAVGLPVANRGWYFSGLAMRMATQMSLQKVDAPGRMPGASMMSGPGIESARRAFWTTLLLEALASFASGEPPPITIQDIHVAEPVDDPPMLGDESAGPATGTSASSQMATDEDSDARPAPAGLKSMPNVCAFTAQLSMLLIRVARLNGNRHPESAQFSPEYATLHAEMVAWYHALPDNMQIRATTARDEILGDPQLFAAKMFVHCHYHAAIIALHQPRVDLVRVESSTGYRDAKGEGGEKKPACHGPPADVQWRQLAQQQCLTAACTMTELLTLARALDVRYHIVTFGFAVFMAGVVHVGAVACTPRDSNERQYSINCVREHVRCLDRLGKYFAFHFIMAKHIRAQLHAIESADTRRQNAAAVAEAMSNCTAQSVHPQVSKLRATGHQSRVPPMPFDINAALAMASQSLPHLPTRQPHTPGAVSAGIGMDAATAAGLFASAAGNSSDLFGSVLGSADAADGSPWFSAPATSIGASVSTPMAFGGESSSIDMFLNLFSAAAAVPPSSPTPTGVPFSPQQQCPIPGSCGGLCGTHSPTTAASMAFQLHQSFSSMAGLGSGLSSLVELFSSNSDGSASLYPENILSSSMLAPANARASADAVLSASVAQQPSVALRSTAQHSSSLSNPTGPLRFTSPGAGGLQQFGSLPPFSPL
ncbi:hypothetical protein GGH94_005198 [Coemansia aciculifera]|uniref:Zn(2)-C6 fungal-type domain-containing protein n=1 Tax=Coemansia aciculifera TaxID=417176 RepID=A0A9W8M435_9FUNG|nr:hypothetical protein GGH94_005198 [Coemansia aciculifera]KAJ2871058.1 hypothetical protein GGH93_005108 [Coemansia aciculifera]